MAAMQRRVLKRAAVLCDRQQLFITKGYDARRLSLFSHLANRKLFNGSPSTNSRQLTSAAAASGDEYDYVVVGAGSAGCTIANRLALSDNKIKVLVTEAGAATDDQSWRVRMPGGIAYSIGNKRFDWCYETSPQVNFISNGCFMCIELNDTLWVSQFHHMKYADYAVRCKEGLMTNATRTIFCTTAAS